MKIALDIDDVVADLNKPLIDYINQLYSTDIMEKQLKTYLIENNSELTKEQVDNAIKRFIKEGWLRKIQPVEGAIFGVKKLSKKHEIHFVTYRLEEQKEDTEYWLQKNFPFLNYRLFFSNHSPKKRLIKSLECELLIDDSLNQAKSVEIPCMLYDKPWNRDIARYGLEELPERIKRVYNWGDILKEIE